MYQKIFKNMLVTINFLIIKYQQQQLNRIVISISTGIYIYSGNFWYYFVEKSDVLSAHIWSQGVSFNVVAATFRSFVLLHEIGKIILIKGIKLASTILAYVFYSIHVACKLSTLLLLSQKYHPRYVFLHGFWAFALIFDFLFPSESTTCCGGLT